MKIKLLSAFGAIVIALFAVFIALDLMFPVRYYGFVKKWCREFSVAPSEVLAVIWTESKFEPRAVSKAGACGLMQLMPSTAKWLSETLELDYADEKLFEPEFNIRLGVYYLSYLKANFEGDYVYAAYNAGEGNVKKWLSSDGRIVFSETKTYVKRIKFVKSLYKFRVASN